MLSRLVNLLVGLIATKLANLVLEHSVLLIEVVNCLFALSVVVHRSFEEEAEEALNAVTAGAVSEVAQEHEVGQSGAARIESRQRKLILICIG